MSSKESKLRRARKYLIAGSFFYHLNRAIKAFFVRARKHIDRKVGLMVRYLCYRRGKVQNNKIFIMTYDNSYNCNPSYIVDEILRQELPIDIVWVCAAKKNASWNGFPEGVRLVKRGSYSMYQEQGSAKIWIDNALNCVWYGMPKKSSQVYINTWHGSMGIKRLSGNKYWLRHAKECKKKTDYCVTNSTFEENVFRTTFWPDTPFLKYGHARNDILFQKEKHPEIRAKVEEFFELEPGKKLMLYAPTFRDDGDTSCYNLDYELLKQALEQRFGGEWIILVRAHFKNRAKKANKVEEFEWLKNASKYPDMQELMSVVDSGITDYSSWAYDYVLTGRPMFLYAEDIEKYNDGRGFYYPLESTPFLIATDNDEMQQNILNFDEQVYADRVDAFLKDKGCYETGKASQLVVEKIKEIMGITDIVTDGENN